MMRCHHARGLLTRRLSEPLPAPDAASLERHLERCAACREAAPGIAAFEDRLRRLQAAEAAPAPDVPVDLAAVFTAGRAPRSGSRILAPAALLAGGAAAALVIGILPRERDRRAAGIPPPASRTAAAGNPVPVPGTRGVIPGTSPVIGPAPSSGRRAMAVGAPIRKDRAPAVPDHRTALYPVRRPRAAERTPVTIVEDELHLDGRDPGLLAQWLTGDAADSEARAWLERQLPPMRDDFVQVPLPRLAAADPKDPAVGDALRKLKEEAKVVDARLFQKVTLQLKAASLEEVCAELERATKVRIRASRGMADEKATVLVKELPARDVLRAVARLFGCMWGRSGEEGRYRYELVQNLREQLAEQEMRTRDVNAALLALDAGMAAYQPYLELTPEQLRRRMEQAKGEERKLLRNVSGPAWGGMQLYHRLTPAERAALASGQPLRYSTDSPRPDRRLPQEWLRPLLGTWGNQAMAWNDRDNNLLVGPLEFLRQQGLSPVLISEWPGATADVTLTIKHSELGQVSLEAQSGYVAPYKDRTPGSRATQVLATGQSPSVGKPDNAAANRALRPQPPFTQTVSLRPKPSCPVLKAEAEARQPGERKLSPREELMRPGPHRPPTHTAMERWERGNRLSRPHVTTADVWEEVHRVTGLPVVADSYTRLYPAETLTVEKATLFEALCKVSDELRVRWRKDGEVLLCRSSGFFWDKLKEVPNRHLRHWRDDRAEQGGLPFDDLLEMALLTDQQLDSRTVGEGVTHCWDLAEWDLLQEVPGGYSPRPWMRFLAELPAEARRRALSPEGITIGSLTPQARQAALTLMDARVALDSQSGLQAMAGWTLRVSYAPSGWYVVSPVLGPQLPRDQVDAVPLCAARTREEALALARRLGAPASPDQVDRSEGVLYLTMSPPGGQTWIVAGERPFRVELPPGFAPPGAIPPGK